MVDLHPHAAPSALPTPIASSPGALLARSLEGTAPHAEVKCGARLQESDVQELVAVLTAADELANYRDANGTLGCAIELARACVGLERVALYMRDYDMRDYDMRDPAADRIILRGTWGTGARGQMTDEHAFQHELSPHHGRALCRMQASGSCGLYVDQAPLWGEELGRMLPIGDGWIVHTPLVVGHELIGMMYNDTALSRAPVDEAQQVRAAVLCSLLASVLFVRRGSGFWPRSSPKVGQGPLLRRVLQALDQDPLMSGERLAQSMGISPGHLARSFKQQMGLSLVEYRNRLRMERFFLCIDGGSSNLLDAALEAGFGSYAQFHRVHRKLLGTTPKELLERRRSMPPDGGGELRPNEAATPL